MRERQSRLDSALDRNAVLSAPAPEQIHFWGIGFVEQGLDFLTRDTTSTTIATMLIWCMFSFMVLQSHRKVVEQAKELRELQELCDALWKEQKDDKACIAKLRGENTELSSENAALQMDILSRNEAQPVRIPQEVVMTEHGRCYHHRSCPKVRNSVFKAGYACSVCVTRFAMDEY